jgi:hypothetical protein
MNSGFKKLPFFYCRVTRLFFNVCRWVHIKLNIFVKMFDNPIEGNKKNVFLLSHTA